jgi:hypothetical protein
MNRLTVLLATIVLVVAGISGVLLADNGGNGPNAQVGAVSSVTATTLSTSDTSSISNTAISIISASTVSVPATTANTGGLPYGCDTPAGSTINQGFNLTVWTSDLSPKSGTTFCVTVGLIVVPGSAISITIDSAIIITLTSPNGQSTVLQQCTPSPHVALGGTPLTRFGCGAYWGTSNPINGVVPAPGHYHVTVTGLLSYTDRTLPSVSSGFNVTLASG